MYFKTEIKRDKKNAFKLFYIPNDDTQTYPFWRLELVVSMLGPLTNKKSPKVVKPTKKNYYKTFRIDRRIDRWIDRRIDIWIDRWID